MKSKHLLILSVVAVILVGMATFTNKLNNNASNTVVGGKVIPDLAINDIHAIEIKAPASTVTVAKTDGIWRVVNRHNYPADFGKVRDLLTKLADLKVLQTIRATEQQRRELQLLSDTNADSLGQPTIIDLKEASGKTLETLLLGKERMRSSANPETGIRDNFPDARFISTSKGRIFLVGDTLSEALTTPRSWMDEEFVKVKAEDIASIEIKGSTNGTIVLSRTTGNADFVMPRCPDGKEADSAKLSRLTSALTYLRFEDVLMPGTPDEQSSMSKPITFTARTFKGETYVITIGKSSSSESKYFARCTVTFSPPLPVAAGADNTNQVPRAQTALNDKTSADTKILSDKLTPWTYILDSYNAESLTMGFADLLKDSPKRDATESGETEEKQADQK